MSTYEGNRTERAGVFVVGSDGYRRPLSPLPSLALRNHSPTGFEWGYGGSGPSQLALAILLDYTGSPEVALRHYQSFKWAFIANAPFRGFSIAGERIQAWLTEIESVE